MDTLRTKTPVKYFGTGLGKPVTPATTKPATVAKPTAAKPPATNPNVKPSQTASKAVEKGSSKIIIFIIIGVVVIGLIIFFAFFFKKTEPEEELPDCKNGSVPVLVNGVYECKCLGAFEGPLCQTCSCVGGTCGTKIGDPDCICPEYLGGKKCEIACKNNSSSVLVDNQYVCKCEGNYTGPACDRCDCLNGSICNPNSSNPPCICPSTYAGPSCSIECKNESFSVLENGQYVCKCKGSFYGPSCDKCDCLNGGACSANSASPPCTCPSTHAGLLCSIECKNGSSSVLENGQYVCKCKGSFYGPSCDKCDCLNGGTCSSNETALACTCPSTHAGPLCSLECKNGFSSILENGEYVCKCTGDFTGQMCEKDGLFSTIIERTYDWVTGRYNDGRWDEFLDSWDIGLTAAGKWNDLPYGTLTATSSTTHNNGPGHLIRLIALLMGDRFSNSIKRFETSVSFWVDSNTTNTNWYYNDIDYPTWLGLNLIVFVTKYGRDAMTKTIFDKAIAKMNRPPPSAFEGQSSANALDIGMHYVWRGALSEDSALIQYTRDKIRDLFIENNPNITVDSMYQDHGPQIQIKSYGVIFVGTLLKLVSYLAGTRCAFDIATPGFQRFIKFVKYTQIDSTRGAQIDWGVMGREVSRINSLTCIWSYLTILRDYIDPENAEIYEASLERGYGTQPPSYKVREFNKHFWTSDYTQHSRKKFLCAVRNCSTRTVESETGNGEFTKGNYFSYGSVYFSTTGKDYLNIQPLWDWCKIPGTTYPYTTSYPSRPVWGANYGKTTFVGGISNGFVGAATLDFGEVNMKAKKSWFFFNEGVLCLGAGITYSADANAEVLTTIDQLFESFPIVDINNGEFVAGGKRYFIPPVYRDRLRYSTDTKNGNWNNINTTISVASGAASGTVFSLWFNHGKVPTGARYAYMITPEESSLSGKTGVENLNPHVYNKAERYTLLGTEYIFGTTTGLAIIANTEQYQIVQCEGVTIYIFHKSDDLDYPGAAGTINRSKVKVNAPCMVIDDSRAGEVWVCDPTQKLTTITITCSTIGSKVVTLPTNEYAGSTVHVGAYEAPF